MRCTTTLFFILSTLSLISAQEAAPADAESSSDLGNGFASVGSGLLHDLGVLALDGIEFATSIAPTVFSAVTHVGVKAFEFETSVGGVVYTVVTSHAPGVFSAVTSVGADAFEGATYVGGIVGDAATSAAVEAYEAVAATPSAMATQVRRAAPEIVLKANDAQPAVLLATAEPSGTVLAVPTGIVEATPLAGAAVSSSFVNGALLAAVGSVVVGLVMV